MGTLGFRYHYSVHLRETPAAVESKLRSQMRRNNPSDLKLRRSGEVLYLRFPSHQAHVATPQMEIILKPDGADGSFLQLVIGPSFGVWKFLKGVLLACALCGFIGLALAFMHWNEGGGVWGLYLMLLSLAGWLFIYFAAEEGKRRGRDRVELMKTFMHDALNIDLFDLDKVNALRGSPAPKPETT
ncbi:MAG: hypothetical protein WEC15_02850 [Flavobacteriales bacterium]